MTTFKQFAEQFLTDNGMFDNQVADVMKRLMESEAADPMRGRWDQAMSGYPAIMKNVLVLNVKAEALKYIDENCPEAWFRPCFLPADQQKAFMEETSAKQPVQAESSGDFREDNGRARSNNYGDK